MTDRELDVLIAEKVFNSKVTFLDQKFGWNVDFISDKDECNNPIITDLGYDGYRLKNYSTNIKDVWDMVEKFQKAYPEKYEESKVFILELQYYAGKSEWYAAFNLEKSNTTDHVTVLTERPNDTPRLDTITEMVSKAIQEQANSYERPDFRDFLYKNNPFLEYLADPSYTTTHFGAWAELAPKAICLAALEIEKYNESTSNP